MNCRSFYTLGKSILREHAPKLHALFRNTIGNSASAALRLIGITLPPYFNHRDRVVVLLKGIERDVKIASTNVIQRGDTVIDIGANVGLLTRHFAVEVGKSGKVLAFEPDPTNLKYLKRNVKKFRQVQVIEVALSDQNGLANLYLNATSGTSNTLVAVAGLAGSVPVECLTLDDFLKLEPLEKIHLIKIDVEGYETHVLMGMTDTLRGHPEAALIIEYCPQNLHNAGVVPESLLEQIRQLEFEMYMISENGSYDPVGEIAKLAAKLPDVGYANLLCVKQGDQRVAALPKRYPAAGRMD